QNKIDGLGNSHEVTEHLRMGDGHGATTGDLLLEDRNDGAAAAQDIAKSHDGEGTFCLPCRMQNQHLGKTVCRAVDGHRAHRLIGGDENKSFYVVIESGLNDVACPKDVVGHGLDNVDLHQRDMLVGSSMEDDLRQVSGKDLCQP